MHKIDTKDAILVRDIDDAYCGRCDNILYVCECGREGCLFKDDHEAYLHKHLYQLTCSQVHAR